MKHSCRSGPPRGVLLLLGASAAILSPFFNNASVGAESVRIATYNLENYLDHPVQNRPAKSMEARAQICENIRALGPDVIALQEVGSLSALEELQSSLREAGLVLPYLQFVSGHDTNIFVGILSRFPFTAQRPHTNETFLYRGRRFRTSRGFGEAQIQVNERYAFTLFAAHLKSRRAAAEADEGELRLQEAKLLREMIDARLEADPNANIVVAGDFNDTKDMPAVRTLIGRGARRLVDVRPAERNGDPLGTRGGQTRDITWTHYFSEQDTYSRIDYLLFSPGMAKELNRAETYVLAAPNWGLASDHRPLVASCRDVDE